MRQECGARAQHPPNKQGLAQGLWKAWYCAETTIGETRPAVSAGAGRWQWAWGGLDGQKEAGAAMGFQAQRAEGRNATTSRE